MKQNERVALQMPSSYVEMSEEEKCYIEGGLNIGMTKLYLNKNYCTNTGYKIVKDFGWTNVTGAQLAAEIYGHAVVYYNTKSLAGYSWYNNNVYSHAANGVDVYNAVDRYQTVWTFIWTYL